MIVKKRRFRNWYVIQSGKGYFARFNPAYWTTAKDCQAKGDKLFGPYWKFQKACREAQRHNRHLDWAIFQDRKL